AAGLLRTDLRRPVDNRGIDQGPARGTARERRPQRFPQFRGHLHELADCPRIGQLGIVRPESGRGQSGHAGSPATLGNLKREPATYGASGQVRTVKAQFVEEPDELLDQGLRYWLPISLEWWRFTVAG